MLLKRGLAFFTDLILLSIGFSVACTLAKVHFSDGERFLALLPSLAIYFTSFLWLLNGRTPGLILFKIQVKHPARAKLRFKDAFLRAVGVNLSYLCFGFGFMLAIVRIDAKNLSDLISGTYCR
jgi:uncharacterized RDD family membrane protein YckC